MAIKRKGNIFYNLLDSENGSPISVKLQDRFPDGALFTDDDAMGNNVIYKFKDGTGFAVKTFDVGQSKTLVVDNVEAIRNLSKSNVLMFRLGVYTNIRTEGYYEPNDGGGFEYLYNPESIVADDGFLSIKSSLLDIGRFNPNIKDFVNVHIAGVIGDGIVNDSINIQKAIDYVSLSKKTLVFEERVYLASSLDFKGAALSFSKTRIKRAVESGYVVRFSGGEKTTGLLIIDNDNLTVSSSSVFSYNTVTIDELTILNNKNSDNNYRMDLVLRGTPDGQGEFSCNYFRSINGGYAGCSSEGSSMKQIFFNNYYCENPYSKGFRCDNIVESIYINNYKSVYNEGTEVGSCGFLIDNGTDISLPFVKNLYINNFYAEGHLSAGAKIQSTLYAKINSFDFISSPTTPVALSLYAKKSDVSVVRSTNHQGSMIVNINGGDTNIGSIESTTETDSLFVQADNWLFGESNIQIGHINALLSTRDRLIRAWFTNPNENVYFNINKISCKSTVGFVLDTTISEPKNNTGYISINNISSDAPVALANNTLIRAIAKAPRSFFFPYSAPPTTGDYSRGDIIYRSNVSLGQVTGWVCVKGTDATPATWATLGIAGLGEATISQAGIATISTTTELNAGTSNNSIITPYRLDTKLKQGVVAAISTADATDEATAIALANENKAKINEIITKLSTIIFK